MYDLIAAVDAEVEPGEEACVAPMVAHLLRAGHAQCLREVDGERLCTDLAPACLQAAELGVPASSEAHTRGRLSFRDTTAR